MEVVYTEVFEMWLRALRDQRARASIASRLRRVQEGNFGDHRSVGGCVSEPRVNVGQGYRVYYTVRRATMVVVLCGGRKSSQQRDVRRAHQIVAEI